MISVPPKLAGEEMFIALCEAMRWWFAFDGPQAVLIAKQDGRLRADDVRRIAKQYNFMRNLPTDTGRLAAIGAHFQEFATPEAQTLSKRAEIIEPLIEQIFVSGGERFRIVSGATKLLWFAAPHRWTPFDRLASAAVSARFTGIRRMHDYYDRLDRVGFLRAGSEIDKVLDGTEIACISGTRVLDKLLMMRGEPEWTSNVRPIAVAFADSLPPTIRSATINVGERIVAEPSCQLDFGALK